MTMVLLEASTTLPLSVSAAAPPSPSFTSFFCFLLPFAFLVSFFFGNSTTNPVPEAAAACFAADRVSLAGAAAAGCCSALRLVGGIVEKTVVFSFFSFSPPSITRNQKPKLCVCVCVSSLYLSINVEKLKYYPLLYQEQFVMVYNKNMNYQKNNKNMNLILIYNIKKIYIEI